MITKVSHKVLTTTIISLNIEKNFSVSFKPFQSQCVSNLSGLTSYRVLVLCMTLTSPKDSSLMSNDIKDLNKL